MAFSFFHTVVSMYDMMLALNLMVWFLYTVCGGGSIVKSPIASHTQDRWATKDIKAQPAPTDRVRFFGPQWIRSGPCNNSELCPLCCGTIPSSLPACCCWHERHETKKKKKKDGKAAIRRLRAVAPSSARKGYRDGV
jgi:hypothetical protein